MKRFSLKTGTFPPSVRKPLSAEVDFSNVPSGFSTRTYCSLLSPHCSMNRKPYSAGRREWKAALKMSTTTRLGTLMATLQFVSRLHKWERTNSSQQFYFNVSTNVNFSFSEEARVHTTPQTVAGVVTVGSRRRFPRRRRAIRSRSISASCCCWSQAPGQGPSLPKPRLPSTMSWPYWHLVVEYQFLFFYFYFFISTRFLCRSGAEKEKKRKKKSN